MVDEASVLWEDLKLQFSAGNGPRISELRAGIANCRQNGDTVIVYFGRLKKLWDELTLYKPIRSCKCGELTKQLEEVRDEECTNTFLNGLDNSRFGTVRSTITSIESLPKLSQVYQRIIREERQQTIVRNRDMPTEVVGFAYGHAQADCFQLKGYPEWWGERGNNTSDRGRGGKGGPGRNGRGGGVTGGFGRGRGTIGQANAAQLPQVVAAAASVPKKEGDYNRQSLPQLNDEQWTVLINFLSSQKSESNEKLNGSYLEDADWSG